MALGMPRVNLFVADGVGLGKTIEAGLDRPRAALRRKVSDIVVCCPPSMVLQWREEMESRFGLLFQIIDRAYVHRIRKERGFNVNPWDTHNRFIISHNLDQRRRIRRGPANLARPRPCSPPFPADPRRGPPRRAGVGGAPMRSPRSSRAGSWSSRPKFEHKLFLSATPHNGHSNSFQTLMAILDPQRFCRGVPVRARERDQVLIYRLKEDLRDTRDRVSPARGRARYDLGAGERDARARARRQARSLLSLREDRLRTNRSRCAMPRRS